MFEGKALAYPKLKVFHLGKLQVAPTNIRLGSKGLEETNIQA